MPQSSIAFAFITVIDVADLDPRFLSLPYTGEVEEHSPLVRHHCLSVSPGSGCGFCGTVQLWKEGGLSSILKEDAVSPLWNMRLHLMPTVWLWHTHYIFIIYCTLLFCELLLQDTFIVLTGYLYCILCKFEWKTLRKCNKNCYVTQRNSRSNCVVCCGWLLSNGIWLRSVSALLQGQSVLTVSAIDRDTGINDRISYSIESEKNYLSNYWPFKQCSQNVM